MGPGRDVDVVVVGAGGAGLAAALAAAEAGATVMTVETAGQVGGSTALSSGSFMAAGTEGQRAAGIHDDADAFFDHYLTFNRWACDPAVVRRFCDDGAPTMRWLQTHGVRYEPDGLYRATRESAPRSHRPVGGGQAVVDALAAAGRAAGTELALGNRVERLVVAGSRVVGVVARGEELRAGAVVLTSGGFARNEALVARYYPAFAATRASWSLAAPTNVGDGLRLAENLGADIMTFNDGITVVTPGLGRERDPFPPAWPVYVNAAGRRFVDETAPYSVLSGIVQRQPGGVWNVFDDDAKRNGARSRDPAMGAGVWSEAAIDGGTAAGHVVTAVTISDLAVAAGIDSDGLVATVRRYNDDCAAGADRQFLKEAAGMRPVAVPPFHAAPVAPRSMSLTTVGVRIDPDGRVLDRLGQPIDGLFAAGEVVGNVIGQQYLGGGNSVGSCLTFGRIAGTAAARAVATGQTLGCP